MDDVRNHSYLALRLRVAGDKNLHSSYFVNVQTKDFTGTEIWQHRLYFQRPNKWEDLFVAFNNFVRVSYGEVARHHFHMDREKVLTVGVAVLGGHSRCEGRYELNVDSIRVVNEEDVTQNKKPVADSQEDSAQDEEDGRW